MYIYCLLHLQYIYYLFIFRDCFIRTGTDTYDERLFMCGLASEEGSDDDIFFKCLQMLNSELVNENNKIYEADARDYFELAAEICYLGMLLL